MAVSALKVEIEDLSAVKRLLKVEVPTAEVNQEVERAYRELGKRAKVKGFRPGKVPRAVLELYYRRQVEQEVSEALVRRSLAEALKERDLEPVSLSWPESPPPAVAGEDYRFSVELEVFPEFAVANYQALTLEDPGAEVTEEMVAARLEEIRQANAVLKSPAAPRGAKEGDFVILDYQGYFAGAALAEARGDNQCLELGAGKFNLDFERQLLGVTPGGEPRFSVALPPDFFNPLIAGKVVEFKVKVHEVKEKLTPELDDAFAQSLGGNFQGLPDLRAAVREDIIKIKERERQARLENQVLEKLLAAHSFEVPASLIRQEQENLLRAQFERLASHGLNLAGLDQEKVRERVRPAAERRVRRHLLLERIAAQEGIQVDETEVEVELAQQAARSGREVALVRQFYQERGLLEGLRRQLREDKALKFILEKAQLAPAARASESN